MYIWAHISICLQLQLASDKGGHYNFEGEEGGVYGRIWRREEKGDTR